MSDTNTMTAAGPIYVEIAGRKITLRDPKHDEIDIALVSRLMQQWAKHIRAERDVQLGPDCALAIDRLIQLQGAALQAIVDRVRTCVRSCAVMIDGAPVTPEALDAAAPQPSADNVNAWWEVTHALIDELARRASPGKS